MIIIIMYEHSFINREKELSFLEKAYTSNRAELIVIYGRRRVGKTELVKKSINNKKAIYFLAEETIKEENLRTFRKIVAKVLENDLIERSDLEWEELFEILGTENVIVVIDEFPYLIKHQPDIVSKFQKIWDEKLVRSPLKLVLIGSSISIMETEVLAYKSPLYGRRTGQMHLPPLRFFSLKDFYPEKPWEDIVRIYSITDGIPAYIKEVQYRLRLGERLEEVCQPNKLLFEEANFLLRFELREPARYFQILKVVALGNTKFGEIVNSTGFPSSTVSQYINNLKTLHIIREENPLGEQTKRRKTRYHLNDNYFHFYFRFIYPNKSVLQDIGSIPDFEREFNVYLGKIFEKICIEYLRELRRKNRIHFTSIGKWWHKDVEIDIVVQGDKATYMFEVKWSEMDYKEAKRLMRKLKKKAEHCNFRGEKKYGLIGRKINNKEALREEFLVWDLDDFEFIKNERNAIQSPNDLKSFP